MLCETADLVFSVTQSVFFYTKGPTHRLEITPLLPDPEPEPPQSVLRLADLTSEEEEGLHGRISQYERKIDSLLSEVSSLKNEVSLSSGRTNHSLISSLFIIYHHYLILSYIIIIIIIIIIIGCIG